MLERGFLSFSVKPKTFSLFLQPAGHFSSDKDWKPYQMLGSDQMLPLPRNLLEKQSAPLPAPVNRYVDSCPRLTRTPIAERNFFDATPTPCSLQGAIATKEN